MNIGLKGALILSFCTLAAGAQQRHEFTASQAADYARKNNGQVKNALLGVQLQEQTNREITASAYPQINGTLSATDFLSIPTNLLPGELAGQPRGTYIPVRFGTKFNESAGVSLQQLLFEGQVFVGLQARDASIAFARKNVEVTEASIIANVYKIYYQLSAGRNQLTLLDSSIARTQRLTADMRKMYENGFAERLDISRFEVQLANLQTERQRAQNLINNGYFGLKLLMGMPMQDSIIITEQVNEQEIRTGVLEAASYSHRDRTEYQYAQIGRTLREYNIRRYRLSKLPTVALTTSFTTNRQANKFGFGGRWFNTSLINLNINLPIFDGFARDARIRRAQIELQQVENQITDLGLLIDSEVQQAINNYTNALATLELQKRDMQLAETVYNQTRLKFQEGLGSNVEITSAQSDLQMAQTNYITGLYDAINAKVEFLRATGRLK